MTELHRWRDLQRTYFPELPFDCGNESDPGVRYCEDLRDWSAKATTPDQWRMENYIDRYDLRSKRILHIGIGNSGLARRFNGRVKEIVGTTIDEPELEVARALALPSYRVVLHNKYSGQDTAVEGTFDFILDNNPTSPCCCVRHLAALFDFYAEKLAPGAQIVTDREGLDWIPDDSNARWSFRFEDLARVAEVAGFMIFRANRNVYVLSRAKPVPPGILPVSRHILRWGAALPGRIVRHAARRVRRY